MVISDYRYKFVNSNNNSDLYITALINDYDRVSYKINTIDNTIIKPLDLDDDELDYFELVNKPRISNFQIDKTIIDKMQNFININPHSLFYRNVCGRQNSNVYFLNYYS